MIISRIRSRFVSIDFRLLFLGSAPVLRPGLASLAQIRMRLDWKDRTEEKRALETRAKGPCIYIYIYILGAASLTEAAPGAQGDVGNPWIVVGGALAMELETIAK